MKFKKFTNPGFLRSIGRPLLEKFFDRFADELAARKADAPSKAADDYSYFNAVAFLLMQPDLLPDGLMEAMFAIEEMATADGQEHLEKAAVTAGLDLRFEPESSHGDVAMQVWLASPTLLARKHNEQRMARLCSFQVLAHGHETGSANGSFQFPELSELNRLTASLDAWFVTHNRGHQTTQIESHWMDGEWWFLVRHGDTFARKARVEQRRTELLHYRPAKDDVVVYSSDQDELRINARTKGERELYREQFGKFLRGSENYFSETKTLTLQPLRTEGRDALDANGVDGIKGIVLREIEIESEKEHGETVRYRSKDFFSACDGNAQLISESSRLLRAVFDVRFVDAKRPRAVEVRPSNFLKVGRHADARLVNQWLVSRGFRSVTKGGNDEQQFVAVA